MTFAAPFSRIIRPPFGPGLAAAGAPAVTTYVLDTFTGTDGTLLPAHTPDVAPGGSAWIADVRVWDIATNQARCTSTGNGSQAVINAGVADCVVRVTLATAATSSTNVAGRDNSLTVRRTSAANAWAVGVNNIGSVLRINQITSGVPTTRASTSHTVANGDVIVATLTGATITALCGTDTVSYASATQGQTDTYHGLGVFNTATRFDDFSVKSA